MESKRDDVDVLEVLDRVLSAALKEVRNVRARLPVESGLSSDAVRASDEGAQPVRKSQTSLCIDILTNAGRPLHVNPLLDALQDRGVSTTRESLVSAITKKLVPVGPFVRTGPNTFGLAGRDVVEG